MAALEPSQAVLRRIPARLTETCLIAVLFLMPAATIASESSTGTADDCFVRLEKDRQVIDSLTLTLDDSTLIMGDRPIVSLANSMLYIERLSASDNPDRLAIPFDRVVRIQYHKPGHLRWAAPLAGFLIGAASGGYAGVSIDSESKGLFNSSEIVNCMIGGLVGGLVGALIGHQIGKHHTTRVVLDCR